MRPPNKSRSRNKNNRRGGGGNIGNALNRVYESAGPDGRVRGTPVQVIEKYQALAYDSALAGDRVATENFQQHAEHYIRMINDVQRQLAEQREQQQANQPQQSQQPHQPHQNNGGGDASQSNQQPNPPQNGTTAANVPNDRTPAANGNGSKGRDEAMSVLDGPSQPETEGSSGLVETPETAAPAAEVAEPPKRKRARPSRSKAAPKPPEADATET